MNKRNRKKKAKQAELKRQQAIKEAEQWCRENDISIDEIVEGLNIVATKLARAINAFFLGIEVIS